MTNFGKQNLAWVLTLVSLTIPMLAPLPARAQDVTVSATASVDSNRSDDAAAIRAQAAAYTQAFAKGDSAALAGMWAPDGTFTDDDGKEFKGRASIQADLEAHFKQFGPHPLEITVESIKFPAANLAIEEGVTRSMVGNFPVRFSRYMAVHVKDNGKWQMAAVTESDWVPPNASSALKDLSWLVGNWSVKQPPSTGVHFNAVWTSNQNFIKCEFDEAANAGNVKTTQIIGWDPIAKQIVSWHFDSSGGFGYGRWVKQGRTWVINSSGVEQDGSTAKAKYLINPVDTNMFTWQSIARARGGSKLPNTQPISIGRDGSVN